MRGPADMTVFEFRSLEDYRRHWQRMTGHFAERDLQAAALAAPTRESRIPFTVEGFSYPAGRSVDLAVEWDSTTATQPTWREYLICPLTGLNARRRASTHVIDSHLRLYPDDAIYITERATPLYQHLRGRFAKLTGSEFIDGALRPGWVDAEGVRHEDLTRTSFVDGQFDAVLSFECLEHIPDFRAALRECRRILRPGGRLMFTAPFAASQEEHVVRAQMRPDGSIEHLLEPEYHGDPIRNAACLCFTHFGWRILEDLRTAGFRDPHVLAAWSREFGYLGDELLFVVASAPQQRA